MLRGGLLVSLAAATVLSVGVAFGGEGRGPGGIAVVNLGGRETNDLVWRDVHVSTPGRRLLVFRCTSPGPGKFFVQIDGARQMPVEVPATSTGFIEVSLPVTLSASVHGIRLSNASSPMPDIDFMRLVTK